MIRVLRIHENVMAVMINTLGRRSQAQSDASTQAQQGEGEIVSKEKVFFVNDRVEVKKLKTVNISRILLMKW